jgi:hypothetical protein
VGDDPAPPGQEAVAITVEHQASWDSNMSDVVIESPVIHAPYLEPQRHFVFGRDGIKAPRIRAFDAAAIPVLERAFVRDPDREDLAHKFRAACLDTGQLGRAAETQTIRGRHLPPEPVTTSPWLGRRHRRARGHVAPA